MITSLLQVALATTGLTVVLAVASRWWRRDDAQGWHLIWTMVAGGALLAAPVAALVPMPELVVRTIIWSPPAIARETLLPGLAAVYLAGLAVMLARLVAGIAAVRRLAAQAVQVSGPDRERLMAILGPDADRCRMHPALVVPVAASGHILLPAAWTQWSATRLQVVLHHECAHLHRRDAWWSVLAAVHHAVYWPSPVAWWLTRVIRRHAEHACDDAAARVAGAAVCARVLVETARDLIPAHPPLPHLALGAHEDLSARIDALLAAPALRARLSRTALVCLMVVVLTALTAAAQPGRAPVDAMDTLHTARHAARHAGHWRPQAQRPLMMAARISIPSHRLPNRRCSLAAC